jgi:hypothetical protein
MIHHRATEGTENTEGEDNELTHQIIGSAIEVHRILGPGLLESVYEAALGYEVSATNLKRVLLRRGAIEAVGERRAHGPAGGRPAGLYRYRSHQLEVTDPFAVLRPPG